MKLPINALLYVVSLAALGGIVHSVYEQYTAKGLVSNKDARKAIRDKMKKLEAEATNTLPNTDRWNYGAEKFWVQLKHVNLIGKIKVVEPEKTDETAAAPKPVSDLVDLYKVIEVICITRAGDKTGAVIRYLPGVDVRVPSTLLVSAPTTVMSNMPKGRRANMPTMPAPSATHAPPHHLHMGKRPEKKKKKEKTPKGKGEVANGDANPDPATGPVSDDRPDPALEYWDRLFPPYEYIYIKGVAPDASSVIFELRIEDKKDDKGNYPTREVFKTQLNLSHEILLGLRSGKSGKTTGDNRAPRRKIPESEWRDFGKETVVRNGNVHVSEADRRAFERDGQKIWSEDVVMKDYSGGSGKYKIRGVQIRKVGKRLANYGVQSGDVLISLNGQKVKGMAHAKRVGNKLHRKGVRTFRAEFLRQGRIITLTYHLKK